MAQNIKDASFIDIKGKWRYGNNHIGIDLAEIDRHNHFRIWIYPFEITLIGSFKQIGFGIKIFKLNFSVNVSIL